jgi:GNAT superfamily N-acetyltransferase
MAGPSLTAGPPAYELEPLADHHDRTGLDCGPTAEGVAITAFFRQDALSEQSANLCRVTVAVERSPPRHVIGFFTLSPTSVPRTQWLVITGLTDAPYGRIGGYLLGRLGVDEPHQRQGIGEALVATSVIYARMAQTATGGAFLAVDAMNDRLAAWYERLGFTRVAANSLRLARRI